MLCIAICDSDNESSLRIQNVILTHKFKAKILTRIFVDTAELCEYIKDNPREIDLLFLDAQAAKVENLGVGKYIRSVLCNQTLQIVYVSESEGLAMSAFDNRPLNFFVKPIDDDRIIASVKLVIELLKGERDYFKYFERKLPHKIPYNEIMYFQSENKKVKVKTISRKHEFYGKLSDEIEMVKSPRFITIHKSYYLNMDFVKEHRYGSILLENGEVLPISQKHRKKVRNAFLKKI